MNDPTLTRIAEALERIASALEREELRAWARRRLQGRDEEGGTRPPLRVER